MTDPTPEDVRADWPGADAARGPRITPRTPARLWQWCAAITNREARDAERRGQPWSPAARARRAARRWSAHAGPGCGPPPAGHAP